MNEIIEKENAVIENMIYEVRGVQVKLSTDTTKFYHSVVFNILKKFLN